MSWPSKGTRIVLFIVLPSRHKMIILLIIIYFIYLIFSNTLDIYNKLYMCKSLLISLLFFKLIII